MTETDAGSLTHTAVILKTKETKESRDSHVAIKSKGMISQVSQGSMETRKLKEHSDIQKWHMLQASRSSETVHTTCQTHHIRAHMAVFARMCSCLSCPQITLLITFYLWICIFGRFITLTRPLSQYFISHPFGSKICACVTVQQSHFCYSYLALCLSVGTCVECLRDTACATLNKHSVRS